LHPALEQGDRSRVRIYSVNPAEDIEQQEIKVLVNMAIEVNPKFGK